MDAAGPGPIAEDGSPVEFYRRLPDGGPGHERIAEAVTGARRVLDLGCGTGGLTRLLTGRGQAVTAVDNSPAMLAEVSAAETVLADIERLDLRPRRFDAVVLASNLVNIADDERRQAFLRCCRRHVADDGVVVVERLDPGWAAEVADGVLADDGALRFSIAGVRRRGRELVAEMRYEADGMTWRQPFVNRVLDQRETEDELAAAGLAADAWVDPRIVVARPLRAPTG